ncbi:1a08903d-7cff-4785-9fdd-5c4cbe85d42c [Thermothielavioides terrestris]|jgi:NAD(P)-dependent dehydrogenase (short-subunit alcohol dehydrogenase family)|uniref:Uncharacterized protein n=2 Tax=Thermothielavioides terrestris TaxID=2587410 RepID=G2RAY4_THETT|nr:uncharacterized protein THITE_2146004 [Thermothielavioides terrestris NRRL 8126]AEO68959.1 hypothetical protein THITE_2146004 [Thermothielavioides terrestris NRRL 8126]SPQ22768.1 1a08903d-7cff-4785-9fdd-5c4cbe85d42c [Thermothielavioides terrestris]
MTWCAKSVSFDPKKDIPPLTDKVILVTGGNVGLGKQAVLEYARHGPGLIWLAARSVEKADAVIDEIKHQVPDANIKALELDLASFASVKKAAATVLSTSPRLDILMLNAGIMAATPGLTADGYELQFGTNHMGHALLTKLLLPLLLQTAATTTTTSSSKNHANNSSSPSPSPSPARIVVLSSDGHRFAAKPGIDFATLKTPAEGLGAFGRYFQSKLANALWARELAARHDATQTLVVAAVHPGMVRTQLIERAGGSPAVVRAAIRAAAALNLIPSVEHGVRNQLWASVAAPGSDLVSGEYYEPVGVAGRASALARDGELARRLWEWTEKELEGHVVEL